MAARALFAFFGRETDFKGDPSERAWTGALLLADGIDNTRVCAEVLKAYAEGIVRAARKKR